MDSSLKQDLSKESSSSNPKSSENEQQKDSQTKSGPTKFTISLQPPSVPAGSGTVGAATASATEAAKSTTTSSLSSSTFSVTSTSSGTPHSVTISLGVGALQVGKPLPRVPSPPKSNVNTTSQDVTSSSTTTTSSVSITPASIASALNKDSAKSAIHNTSTTSSDHHQNTSAAETTKSSSVASTHSHPIISNPLLGSASSSASPGGATNSPLSSTSAMKRPPSEISGLMSSSAGSVSETPESEAGVEHKRKKMRKEANRGGDRSDSPASSVSSINIGRGVRNSGSKQSGGNSAEFVQKSSNDSTTAGKEKAEDSSKNQEPFAGGLGNSGGGSNTSSGVSNNGSGGPKVPPLKIVLQSHSHNVATTSSETPAPLPAKGSAGGEETSQNSSYGQVSTASGFPYVVSVATSDSNATSEGAQSTPQISSGNSNSSVGQDQKETKDTGKDAQYKGTLPLSGSSSTSTASNQATNEASSTTSTTTSSVSTLVITSSAITATTSTTKDSDRGKANSANEATSSSTVSQDKTKYDEEKKESSSSVRPATPATGNDQEKEKEATSSKDKESNKEVGPVGSHTDKKEKPVRVTRSSQRILKEGGTHTPNSPSSSSPKTSACPSPSHSHQTDSQGSVEASTSAKQGSILNTDAPDKAESNEPVELHPRKRKIKNKDITKETAAPPPPPPPPPSVASTSSSSGNVAPTENMEQQQAPASAANDQPMLNCFEMYLNIRKQIDRRRRNLFPVTPKPPKGFKDYLMNRGTYVLAGNANSLAVNIINPPSNMSAQMKEFFAEQEKDRHKLRLQHLVEKEKLVLSVEQEILRVHGRAARALSNQTLPFSVCTILKDQEVYNLLTPEQEEKDINARSRYNGRLFLSWLQDVDDKWDKIKEYMLLRHHNEAESLHAVQKMDWEWKLKEYGLCEPKATPQIDDLSVPMVHVSDDFDLLPA